MNDKVEQPMPSWKGWRVGDRVRVLAGMIPGTIFRLPPKMSPHWRATVNFDQPNEHGHDCCFCTQAEMVRDPSNSCFFCEDDESRCDCGKFDAVPEDVITSDGQRRIDAMHARREYLRKNPPAVCVQKSSKGMTCDALKYVAGEHCRQCPSRK